MTSMGYFLYEFTATCQGTKPDSETIFDPYDDNSRRSSTEKLELNVLTSFGASPDKVPLTGRVISSKAKISPPDPESLIAKKQQAALEEFYPQRRLAWLQQILPVFHQPSDVALLM